MATGSNAESDAAGATESAHAFRDFIEARYSEWENEFGDNVHVRRTVAFDPKN